MYPFFSVIMKPEEIILMNEYSIIFNLLEENKIHLCIKLIIVYIGYVEIEWIIL